MSCILGAALVGVDGAPIEVEVRIHSLLPRVDIVGLPEAAVRESAARVRAAIAALGVSFPNRRVTVNLAPAGLRKSGAGLDLPIAIGILAAQASVPAEPLAGTGFLGELALDGRIRGVRGALAQTLALRDAGARRVVVAQANAREAALAPNVRVFGARSLADVAAHLQGSDTLEPAEALDWRAGPEPAGSGPALDLRDVRGQPGGKRALEIAAAGGHTLLMVGPPGSGKTMLARRLPGLLPALEFDEALEATRIHGAAGLLADAAPIVARRPFRAPHHTASAAGIFGGGNPPRPGEASLAHRGILFLDELPEFDRRVLESLRQVLETGRVELARARASCRFPARFQLVAAANPCPCGWRLSRARDCRCDDGAVARYTARMSGPLLDRVDLHLRLPAVEWKALDSGDGGEASQAVRDRVAEARVLQARRLRPLAATTNAEIPDSGLDGAIAATPDARALLGRAVERLALSARGARRALRVSRTIADLAGEAKVGTSALAEALGLRDPGSSG